MSEQAPPNTESSEVEVAWVRDNQMIIKYLQHWIPQFTNTFHTTLYHSVRYVPSSFIPSSPSSHPPPTFIPLLPSLLHSPPPSFPSFLHSPPLSSPPPFSLHSLLLPPQPMALTMDTLIYKHLPHNAVHFVWYAASPT